MRERRSSYADFLAFAVTDSPLADFVPTFAFIAARVCRARPFGPVVAFLPVFGDLRFRVGGLRSAPSAFVAIGFSALCATDTCRPR